MPMGVLKKMSVDHSGMILIRVLRSSTSFTVHSLHEFPYEPSNCSSSSVCRAARFKNLHGKNGTLMICAHANQSLHN